MPCYTVQTMSVAFKAKHKDMLLAALMELNWQYQEIGQKIRILSQGITLDLATEQANLQSSNLQASQDQLNTLKRAYAMEGVKVLARKQHWAIKLKTGESSKVGTIKGVLQRRN